MKKHNYGPMFKAIRKSLGWTLERMGMELGVGMSTVSYYETGARMPRVGTLLWYFEQSGNAHYNEIECQVCHGTGKVKVPIINATR